MTLNQLSMTFETHQGDISRMELIYKNSEYISLLETHNTLQNAITATVS